MKNKSLNLAVIVILLMSAILGQNETRYPSEKSQNFPLNELREQLNYLFNDQNFSSSLWAVEIKSLKNSEVFYQLNSNKLVNPASNVKLFTTASALLLLGSNYLYKTPFLTDGKISKGVLTGNLIIYGSGDPTFSSRFFEGEDNKIFKNWCDSLKNIGIKKVKGNLIGVTSKFDDSKYGKGWVWENLSEWFSAPTGALSCNENLIELKIRPAPQKTLAEIEVIPNLKYFKLDNRVIVTSGKNKTKISAEFDGCGNTIKVTGNISDSTELISAYVPIQNPSEYFLNTFASALSEAGIEFEGEIVEQNLKENDSNLILLFSHSSPELSQIITAANKTSNNFIAEQLLKTLGYEIYGYGSLANGLNACADLFDVMAINSNNINIVDGSGLSEYNLISPKQINNLLSYMYKSDEFNSFYSSLPIAGVDGTLSERMIKSKTKNNLRAKTGYNKGVKALSGYIKTEDGEPIVLSIIVNNFLVPATLAEYIQDQVCIKLANFSRK